MSPREGPERGCAASRDRTQQWLRAEDPVALLPRCAIENSGQRLYSLQFVGWGVAPVSNYMLLILGAVIVSVAVAIIPRMGVPGGVNGRALGWMSEQWLAEHRASHSV